MTFFRNAGYENLANSVPRGPIASDTEVALAVAAALGLGRFSFRREVVWKVIRVELVSLC